MASKTDRKVALVTGAARGIGKGIAERLAQDGCDLAMLDIDSCTSVAESLAQCYGVRTLPIEANVGAEPQVADALARVAREFGRLDYVVNNAGIANPSAGPIEQLEREEWDMYLEVNLTGYFLIAKHSVPLLRETNGVIVNIASIHAFESERDHNTAYASTKGGVVAMTHALALELGPVIRVNSISPGWIDTREESVREQEPLEASDHAQHPVGRVGLPGDVASLAAYLLSEQAAFITGQDFIVDGGITRKIALD